MSTIRSDTAARNRTPKQREAIRAGQLKRWSKYREMTGDRRATILTEKRAKPATQTQAEINARAEAKRAARAAARLAASIAAPMTLTDWRREYELWADDLRAGGFHVGPAWGIWLPRDRLALTNARLGYPGIPYDDVTTCAAVHYPKEVALFTAWQRGRDSIGGN